MMDQFALGIEGRPVPNLKVNILGLARRQSPQIHGVNTGVPISGYTTFAIPDVAHDLHGPGDDQMLTIYNRRPEMFASDRYCSPIPTDGRDDGVGGRVGRAHHEARLLPDGRHLVLSGRRCRQSWIHRRRERSGDDR